MRPIPILTLIPLFVCTGLTGCASILGGGSHETVRVSSNPAGARVRVVDGKGKEVHTGTTPFSVSLKRGGGYFANAKYELKATAPGYAAKNVPAHAKLNGWYVGNVLFGGLIGLLVVDPISGAMWDLPDDVLIEFASAGNRPSAGKTPSPPPANTSKSGVSQKRQH